MLELQKLFLALKRPRWHVTLYQALLGANLQYLAYRFRYLIFNNMLATILHLFEFYLLGLYFNNQQFFSLILLRAFTLIIKNSWWGALEGLREKIRRYVSTNKRDDIPQEISCWFYSGAILASLIFIIGLFGLWSIFPLNQHNTPERFMFYGLAMLLQLVADMLTRVIHSGIFATQRIYRPWWTIPCAEILGFMTIIIVMPVARSWCLPISYIVFSSTALYITWHYASKAYHLRAQKILVKVSWENFKHWWNILPLRNIFLASAASAAMSLEGIILWLLQPLTKTDPLIFKLVYLLSPQISAGFDWARMCYFDLKKLHSQKWNIFLPRFYAHLLVFSAVMGIIFWLLSCVTTQFFLPEISIVTLFCLLPLFIGRSILAFYQIQLFAKNYFLTVIFGTVILMIAVICSNFFHPEAALLLIFTATFITIIMSLRPHFKAKPIFPLINLIPIYEHLEHSRVIEKSINIIYMEISKQINNESKLLFLEKISQLLGKNKLSLLSRNCFLITLTDYHILDKIKNVAIGKVEHFQETGWKKNGVTALSKAYFLKIRVLNFEKYLDVMTFLEQKNQFLKEFPHALMINLNSNFYQKVKKYVHDKKTCSQLVRAISNGYLSASCKVQLDQYFVLFYINNSGKYIFIDQSSKETLPSIKQWQKRFWQMSMKYFCT